MRAAGRQSTLVASAFAMVLLIGNPARADIKGIRGRQVGNVKQFGLTVKPAHIVTPDGGSLLIWGFTDDDNSNKGSAQLPTLKHFGLAVNPAHIVTPDGGSLLIWGFTDDDNSNKGSAQLPGPTLI